MSLKTPRSSNQEINLNHSSNSGVIKQVGRDILEVGRDYINYIQLNSRTGHWGAVFVALAPFLILPILGGGVGFGGGVSAAKQQFSSELRTQKTELQAKGTTIEELKQQILENEKAREENVKAQQSISKKLAESQQQITSLQTTLKQQQAKLNKQEGLIQQKEQETQNLKAQLKQPIGSTSCSGDFVTQDKLDRLNTEMSLEQVEAILGRSERRVSAAGGSVTYRWRGDCSTPFDLTFFSGGLFKIPSIE